MRTPTSRSTPRHDLIVPVRSAVLERRRFGMHRVLRPTLRDQPTGGFERQDARHSMRLVDSRRAPDGNYKNTAGRLVDDSFITEPCGLERLIDARRVARYGGDAERVKRIDADELSYQLLLDMENRAISAITTAFPVSGTTGANVATPWTTAATATPRANVQGAAVQIFNKCGATLEELQVVLGYSKAMDVLNTNDFRDKMKIDSRRLEGNPTEALLREYFEVGEVVVLGSSRNTANQGVAASMSNLWTAANVFVGVRPAESEEGVQVGRAFLWPWAEQDGDAAQRVTTQELIADGQSYPFYIEEYPAPTNDGDKLRVKTEMGFKIYDDATGWMLGNC